MGSDTKRIFLATAISMAILLAYQTFFAPKPPPKRPAAPAPAETAQPAAPAAPAPSDAPAAPAVPPDAPEETVVLKGNGFTATFTSFGGALKSLVLEGEKYRRADKDGRLAPVDLVRTTEGQPLPLSVAVGPELGGTANPAEDPSARAPMRVVARDDKSVTFEGRAGAVELRKRFSVTGKPFELAAEIEGRGDRAGTLAILYPAYVPPDAPKPGFFSGGEVFETVAPMCRAGGSTKRFRDGEPPAAPGTPRWIGLDQQYFVAAAIPQTEAGECVFTRGPKAGAMAVALKVPFDRQVDTKLVVFAGPKQIDLLQGYGRELDTAIDYGAVANLFSFFARMLLWIMRQLHTVVHNWGLAIILLTALVKLALYPLTAKSMQSMNEMRKLQPEIEKLKAKFGDDREKMNLAVMQLYQQHKVNPLGGCLPLLLQMPIFFALYAALQTSVELYHEQFLWIPDLTRHDPLYILPLAMGASQFVMQRLSPQPADSAQAKMLLYVMPVFFTVIMFKLPAGLTLYIFANNLISMAQQQWLMRRSAAPPAVKAA